MTLGGLPDWVSAERLLGPGWSRADDGRWQASLPRSQAADLAARLRGLGFGGQALALAIAPRLKRPAIRAGRTRDARLRRVTTPGFTRPGVRLDEEGRYSLTPESIALWLGRRAARLGTEPLVLDACCGAGGNAIGFARAGCRVVALERDRSRLALARHNAGVYGVAQRIRFQQADSPARLRAWPGPPADLLFVDPPWGVDWPRDRCGLEQLPLLAQLIEAARAGAVAGQLWAKVPPSFDPSCVPDARAEAVFGQAKGDRHRVKFVLLRLTLTG